MPVTFLKSDLLRYNLRMLRNNSLFLMCCKQRYQLPFALDYIFRDICVANSLQRQRQYLPLEQRTGMLI